MRSLLSVVVRPVLHTVAALVTVVVLWQVFVSFSSVSSYVAKGPLDVLDHLFTGPSAAENRALLLPLTWVTLKDAALGFGAGMVLAVAAAVLFNLSRTVEAGVMPLALLLRSIPLVAIAPVVMLITGRASTASVVVLGIIVVLFPALAAILFGLGQASRQSLDLVAVYGGSRLTAIRKVSLPGALPSIFAAARVSVPGAVTGALLAEWLSTGQGIGGQIQKFPVAARFDDLWAAVAIITVVTLVLYNLVQLLESIALDRMGMSASQ